VEDHNRETIDFFDRDMPYFEFSNFSRHGFELDGRYWPTVEHYYQASKFMDEHLKERIRRAATPRQAKDLGRSLTPLRPDWNSVKEQVMLEALRSKFKASPLKQLLLSTGDKVLVEASPLDDYWGSGKQRQGLNRLGILLMQVRDELISQEQSV